MSEWELKLVQLLDRMGKALRNIYLPKKNGETSEVDVVFIIQKDLRPQEQELLRLDFR